MRRFRVPIGSVRGIRLFLHVTWFPVVAVAVWLLVGAFGDAEPTLPVAERAAMAVVTGVAFFGSLAAHELAHATVARRFGIGVRGITLFLFGGIAEIDGEVPSPGREFVVAIVGPAMSIAIAAASGSLAFATDRFGWEGAAGVFLALATVNAGLAIFNLIPGLPLDGGRLLRAAIWRVTGDFRKATRAASLGGRLLAIALIGGGLFLASRGDAWGLWYVFIGTFVWSLAGRSARARVPAERPALAFDGEGQAPQPGP